MKKLLITIIAIALPAIFTLAQESGFEYYQDRSIRTLVGKSRSAGGYISFSTGHTIIDNKHALLFGGRIAWIADKTLGIGIGGTGFINEYHYEPTIDRDVFLAGGYGGIYIEPIIFPRSPVHIAFPVLFGAGGISYVSNDFNYNFNYNDTFVEDFEPFLIIEPSAEIELNMTRFIRLAFGASYRYPTTFNFGTSGPGFVSASSLKGWSYVATIKLGWF
jgi:hypothetical protein